MLEEIGSDINSLIIIINIFLEVQIIIVRTLEMCAWPIHGTSREKLSWAQKAESSSSREKMGSVQEMQSVWRHRRLPSDIPRNSRLFWVSGVFHQCGDTRRQAWLQSLLIWWLVLYIRVQPLMLQVENKRNPLQIHIFKVCLHGPSCKFLYSL